jgi:hypothetical protein
MEKKLSILLALSVLTLGLASCTQEERVLNNPPGKYKKTTTSTDSSGTTTDTRSSTDVSVDEYGNKKAVIKSKTSRDPKGLFNKTTNSSTQIIEE